MFFFLQQYEIESSTYQKALTESTQIYDKKVEQLNKQLEEERAHAASCVEQLDFTNKLLIDCKKSIQVDTLASDFLSSSLEVLLLSGLLF